MVRGAIQFVCCAYCFVSIQWMELERVWPFSFFSFSCCPYSQHYFLPSFPQFFVKKWILWCCWDALSFLFHYIVFYSYPKQINVNKKIKWDFKDSFPFKAREKKDLFVYFHSWVDSTPPKLATTSHWKFPFELEWHKIRYVPARMVQERNQKMSAMGYYDSFRSLGCKRDIKMEPRGRHCRTSREEASPGRGSFANPLALYRNEL